LIYQQDLLGYELVPLTVLALIRFAGVSLNNELPAREGRRRDQAMQPGLYLFHSRINLGELSLYLVSSFQCLLRSQDYLAPCPTMTIAGRMIRSPSL